MAVAKVRPTGQMRQNTGNPQIAADTSEPPSTTWRPSTFANRRLSVPSAGASDGSPGFFSPQPAQPAHAARRPLT